MAALLTIQLHACADEVYAAMQMSRPSHSLRTWRSCASSQSSMPSGEAAVVLQYRHGEAVLGACGPSFLGQSIHLTPSWIERRTGTYFCVDKSVTAVVIQVSEPGLQALRCMTLHVCTYITYDHSLGMVQTQHGPHRFEPGAFCMQGLAENKDDLGAPLCPCRHYDDKQAEADQGFWNCPCVPMRERKVGLTTRSTV